MSDGNQLPPAGETACPTYFAKRLIQQGGAGGFACRSDDHNQRSASKMNKFPKTVRRPWGAGFPGPAWSRPVAGSTKSPRRITREHIWSHVESCRALHLHASTITPLVSFL